MKEMFFEVYRRYAGYHAQKDQLVWLPAAAYLAFVGGVVSAIGNHAELLRQDNLRWGIIECLSLICALVVIFLCIQNRYKISASVISDRLDCLLLKFDAGDEPTAHDVRDAIREPATSAEKAGKGNAGIVLIVLTAMLGFAQVLFVIFLDR